MIDVSRQMIEMSGIRAVSNTTASAFFGISVALALSIPAYHPEGFDPGREVIRVATYVVVVFSILVQGLTVGLMTRRWRAHVSRTPPGGETPAPL